MATRRAFLKAAVRGSLITLVSFMPFFPSLGAAWGKARKLILPKGTKPETLIQKNPADLDTRNLDVTPLKDFGTMGLSDHKVELEKWRLQIEGPGGAVSQMTYSELTSLPSIERDVLLICPGFFANFGRWKGVSIKKLIPVGGEEPTHVTVHGPRGSYEKVDRFPLPDILSDKVFLAYAVNGQPLPEKHGFPLRIVAEGYYGSDWTKYVYKIKVERISEDDSRLGEAGR